MYKIENKGQKIAHIFINGVISEEDGIGVVNDMRNMYEAGVEEIIFRINSYGGSVKAAYDIVSEMKTLNIVSTAINEGFAVSAASVILAAADKAKAFDFSMAMIHDPLMGNKSLEQTSNKDREFLQRVKDGIIQIYKSRINIPVEQLSKMLTKETSLNALEQKELGLVDEIIKKNSKPKIKDSYTVEDIYNVFEEYNKIEIENMAKTEKNIETPVVENIETPAVENINAVELTDKINNLNNEVTKLKVENFILKHSLSTKEEIINKAVEAHGVSVLETIAQFIELTPKVETPVENTQLVDELHAIVNEANKLINDEIVESAPSDEDLMSQAKEIFDFAGDNEKRLFIKQTNNELYEKLFDVYSNSL